MIFGLFRILMADLSSELNLVADKIALETCREAPNWTTFGVLILVPKSINLPKTPAMSSKFLGLSIEYTKFVFVSGISLKKLGIFSKFDTAACNCANTLNFSELSYMLYSGLESSTPLPNCFEFFNASYTYELDNWNDSLILYPLAKKEAIAAEKLHPVP